MTNNTYSGCIPESKINNLKTNGQMKNFEDFRHLQLDEVRGGAQAPRKQARARDEIFQGLDQGLDDMMKQRLTDASVDIVDTSHSDAQIQSLQRFMDRDKKGDTGDYNADERPEVGADQSPPLGSPEQRNREMAWRSAVGQRDDGGATVDIRRSADGQVYGGVSGDINPLASSDDFNKIRVYVNDVAQGRNQQSAERVQLAKNLMQSYRSELSAASDSESRKRVRQKYAVEFNRFREGENRLKQQGAEVDGEGGGGSQQVSLQPDTQMKPQQGDGNIGTVYDKEIQSGIGSLLSGNSYLSDEQRGVLTKEFDALNQQMQKALQSNNAGSDEVMNLRRQFKDTLSKASKVAEKQREEALSRAFGDEQAPDVKIVADKAASRITEPSKQEAKRKTTPVKSKTTTKAKPQQVKKGSTQRVTGGSGGSSGGGSGTKSSYKGDPVKTKLSQKDYNALHRVEVVVNEIKKEISELMKRKKATKDKNQQKSISQQIAVLAQKLEDIFDKKFQIQKTIDQLPQ